MVRRRAGAHQVFLIVLEIKDPDDMSARHRFRSPIRLDALKQFSGTTGAWWP